MVSCPKGDQIFDFQLEHWGISSTDLKSLSKTAWYASLSNAQNDLKYTNQGLKNVRMDSEVVYISIVVKLTEADQTYSVFTSPFRMHPINIAFMLPSKYMNEYARKNGLTSDEWKENDGNVPVASQKGLASSEIHDVGLDLTQLLGIDLVGKLSGNKQTTTLLYGKFNMMRVAKAETHMGITGLTDTSVNADRAHFYVAMLTVLLGLPVVKQAPYG